MIDIKKAIERFESAFDTLRKHGLSPRLDVSDKSIYDFKEKKKVYYVNLYKTAFNELAKLVDVSELEEIYLTDDFDKISEIIARLKENIPKIVGDSPEFDFDYDKIPSDIREDVKADIVEMKKCFSCELYRSAVILCGRVLEAALHRRYYDATGQDILEKSPGIGLGNLIAKMKEKDIAIDPALTNQIHLINQVRIFSVHKKKEVFKPNKAQCQAVILYTLDTLEKLFVQPNL